MIDIDFSTKVRRDTCAFVNEWQKMLDAYREKQGYKWPHTLSVSWGKKYAKIITEDMGQKSVSAFVNLENGDILMAASWAKPAKHARGNVHSEQRGMESVDNQGYIKYLK